MPEEKHNICNSKTFEVTYQTYAKDLRRFVYYKTQDLDEAEDIVQETFVKLWNNCANVDATKVKSYLYTVATNTFLNVVKHAKVVHKHQQSITKQYTNETPEFIILEKEFMERLERTIQSLPEKQREVFLLNRIEKKKYKEIAEQLDISIKAVEKRMHLALLVIRKEIGNI